MKADGPFVGKFCPMTDREQHRDHREPKRGGPDRFLMFFVLAFIGKVLLRAFWVFD
jgi:hypothetical protein